MVEALAAKLKRTGAELSYIAMDEPLWFGQLLQGKECLSLLDRHCCRARREEPARVSEGISKCRHRRHRAISIHHRSAVVARGFPALDRGIPRKDQWSVLIRGQPRFTAVWLAYWKATHVPRSIYLRDQAAAAIPICDSRD